MNNANLCICPGTEPCSCPATEALKQAQEEMKFARRNSRQANFDESLSSEMLVLSFSEDLSSFPIIAWDSDEESASSNSSDMWNSCLSSNSKSLLGKRSRNGSREVRRLVRSRKIRSNLASLVSISASS